MITAFYAVKPGWMGAYRTIFVHEHKSPKRKEKKKEKKKKPDFDARIMGSFCILFYFVYWNSLVNSFLLSENSLNSVVFYNFQKFHTYDFI